MLDPVLVTNPARPRDHGSGFVIRRLAGDGGVEVVTCAHVVRTLGADGLRVADQPARVVIDLGAQGIDLAVLAVAGLDEPAPLPLARGTAGEPVELLGFEPAGGGPIAVPHRGRLAKASVTALAGRNRPAWHLELDDGAIEGGHSGGPVISVRTGCVVGVISMGPDQQGGRDGVAVAIENLRAWKDAPPIGEARGLGASSSGDGSSSDALLPRPWWQRHWRWMVIGAVSLVGAVAVAVAAAPSPAAPPSGCDVPDLRDSYADVAEDAWCPDAIADDTPCVRTFDDGSVVTGRCDGTNAAGEWSSRDSSGFERWHVRFAEAGRRPTATLTSTRRLTSGAVDRTELRRGLLSGNRTYDASTQEVSCSRQDEFASVTRERADLASPDVEVTLSVPQGVLTCRFAGAERTCNIEEQVVTGTFADDTYKRLQSAEQVIRACNIPALPRLARCGDGRVTADEECDDGGVDSERCDADCTLRVCGDRHVNRVALEQCDVGGETAECDRDCTVRACGDSVVNAAAGEQCDPGLTRGEPRDTRTCDADCTRPTCGDGVWNKLAEPCDDGGVDSRTCNATCTKVKCGDGHVNTVALEECDPPNSKTCPRCKLPRLRLPGSP